MIVSKFGGTSVADGSRFAAVARLIASGPAQPRLVVVSAMARVTRELLRIGQVAAGAPAEAREGLEGVLERHRVAIEEARAPASERAWLDDAIEAEQSRVLELLAAAEREGITTARSADRILAVGELLSSRILAATLRGQGVAVTWIDPRDLVVTDSGFGAARPDPAAIARRVERLARPALERGDVVVTGGYVGRARDGATTTLGFEASDYSATLLGAALVAPQVEIWTDVDGVASADPKVVAGARVIPNLSYEEAADLAFFGAGVLHPDTMAPLVPLGASIRVRNSFRPEAPGTVIASAEIGPGIRGVTTRGPFSPAELAGLLAGECGARAFRARNGHPLPAVVEASRLQLPALELPSGDLLKRLVGFADGSPDGLSVVSLVGAQVPSISRLARRAAAALEGFPLLHAVQRDCTTHLSLLLPARLGIEAVCRLHRELLEVEGPPA
jgi:aspartate kinase